MGYGPDIISRQFHTVHWMNIDKHCWNPLTSDKGSVRYLWVLIKDVFKIDQHIKQTQFLDEDEVQKQKKTQFNLNTNSFSVNEFILLSFLHFIFKNFQTGPEAHRSHIQRVPCVLSPGVQLTAYLYLVPKLRMTRAIPLVDWYRGYGATTPCAPRP
jgi:hypothetical protein